eukprot:gene12442-14699_t
MTVYLKRYGDEVRKEHLFVTNGVSHAIDMICTTFLSAGDTVVVESPTYFLATNIFKDHGLDVQSVPGDGNGLCVDALEERLLDGLRPRMVYLVPTHGNPSGKTLPAERRLRLVHLAHQYQFLILADEVYHLLDWTPAAAHNGGGRPPRMVAMEASSRALDSGGAVGNKRQRQTESDEDEAYNSEPAVLAAAEEERRSSKAPVGVLGVSSFTKILAPGLRLGWVEARPELLKSLTGKGYIVSGGGVAPFVSEVVTEALQGGGQDRHLDLLCDEYRPVWVAATKRSGRGPMGWRALQGITATDLLPVAKKHEVALLPGGRCCPDGTLHDSHIRLCFAYLSESEIKEGVS